MSLSQNNNSQIFVDYIPAELHENKTWEVVYYVKNPFTEKLARKRNRVKPLKSVSARKKLAKRMVSEINKRLENGWNPFMQSKGTKELTPLFTVIDIYVREITVEYKDNNLRHDSFLTYNSRIRNFKKYLEDKRLADLLCYKVDEELIREYLDYLRYTKKLAPRSRDNYMTFLNTLFAWMVHKKYLVVNPCEHIKKINKKQKNRIIIPAADRELIFNFYQRTNKYYLALCMTCYYCFTRRTELSKIKVGDVNLKNSTLFISAEDSKNHRSAYVTIPPRLSILLADHIKEAKFTDYLFSNDNYRPGTVRFKPNKATSNWWRMRKELKLNHNIKWYSLKDSGITDLILAGVPLISVRDQARHHSIKQTDEYTPRSMKRADEFVKNSGVSFR